MSLLGYKGRTSFLSSLTVAQISEFSLILIFLGAQVGHVSSEIVSIITLVAVITISVSTYLILHNNAIYDFLSKMFPFLKSKRFFEESLHKSADVNYSVICLGFGETGKKVLSENKKQDGTLIIDFDPRALNDASQKGFQTLYGDVGDLEVVDFISSASPKIVVSTIMDPDSNIRLAKKLLENNGLTLVVLAHNEAEAKKLKSAGVEFVLVPTFLAAEKTRIILDDIEKGRSVELNWLKNKEFF
jgi:hypothetical protein